LVPQQQQQQQRTNLVLPIHTYLIHPVNELSTDFISSTRKKKKNPQSTLVSPKK